MCARICLQSGQVTPRLNDRKKNDLNQIVIQSYRNVYKRIDIIVDLIDFDIDIDSISDNGKNNFHSWIKQDKLAEHLSFDDCETKLSIRTTSENMKGLPKVARDTVSLSMHFQFQQT